MDIQQLGVGAAIAYLIIKEVLAFVTNIWKSKKGAGDDTVPPPTIAPSWALPLIEQSRQMFDWHNQHDEDGVPVWYVRRRLEEAIEQISSNLGIQTKILEKMMETANVVPKGAAASVGAG